MWHAILAYFSNFGLAQWTKTSGTCIPIFCFHHGWTKFHYSGEFSKNLHPYLPKWCPV